MNDNRRQSCGRGPRRGTNVQIAADNHTSSMSKTPAGLGGRDVTLNPASLHPSKSPAIIDNITQQTAHTRETSTTVGGTASGTGATPGRSWASVLGAREQQRTNLEISLPTRSNSRGEKALSPGCRHSQGPAPTEGQSEDDGSKSVPVSIAKVISPSASLAPPRTPSKTFTFGRGHGVVILHEVPGEQALTGVAEVEVDVAEIAPKEISSLVEESLSSAPAAATRAAASLSWAEKARAAAAHHAPPIPKPQSTGVSYQKPAPQSSHGKSPSKEHRRPVDRRRRGSDPGAIEGRTSFSSRNSTKTVSQGHSFQQQRQIAPASPLAQRAAYSVVSERVQQPLPSISTNTEPNRPSASESAKELMEGTEVVSPAVLVETESFVSDEAKTPVATEIPVPPLPNGTPCFPNAEEALSSLCSPEPSVGNDEALRFHPLGIQNPGNLCFVNAVLQALMGSSGFCKLMRDVRGAAQLLDPKRTPILVTLGRIGAEFERKDTVKIISKDKTRINGVTQPTPDAITSGKGSSQKVTSALLGARPVGSAIVVDLVHRFAPGQERCTAGDVEQEDAHEFLHFLLDGIHEELLSLRKQQQQQNRPEAAGDDSDGAPPSEEEPNTIKSPVACGANEEQSDEDGWLVQSGRKAVRRQEVSAALADESSVITSLVQGKLSTSVSSAGSPASVTVHPFKVIGLPINLDSVRSVRDALEALTAAETISGYKPSGGGSPRDAAKIERFAQLPNLLVLHVMRFQYTSRSMKVNKHVSFDTKLTFRPSWMVPGNNRERGQAMVYRLVASVTHHGKSIGSGHYTTDVVQPEGHWLRFDDDNVFSVGLNAVMAEKPYLLIYERI